MAGLPTLTFPLFPITQPCMNVNVHNAGYEGIYRECKFCKYSRGFSLSREPHCWLLIRQIMSNRVCTLLHSQIFELWGGTRLFKGVDRVVLTPWSHRMWADSWGSQRVARALWDAWDACMCLLIRGLVSYLRGIYDSQINGSISDSDSYNIYVCAMVKPAWSQQVLIWMSCEVKNFVKREHITISPTSDTCRCFTLIDIDSLQFAADIFALLCLPCHCLLCYEIQPSWHSRISTQCDGIFRYLLSFSPMKWLNLAQHHHHFNYKVQIRITPMGKYEEEAYALSLFAPHIH